MNRERITQVKSKAVVLPMPNCDTDQIIPARFLKVTTRLGLGQHAFSDLRYGADGKPKPDFVLNQAAAQGARILVAGDNFGCGSSREHAPWALHDFGFRAVVSTSFADIFRNNALKNGLLIVPVSHSLHARLMRGEGNPLTIDLPAQTISLDDGTQEEFVIDAFAKYRLVNGIDEMDFLLQHEAAIAAFEKVHA